jgi:hypothetical protein
VTVRHAVLPIGAALVLGLGVYLFVEVRAQPVREPAHAVERTARPLPPAAPAVQQAVLGDAPAATPPRSSDRPSRVPMTGAAGSPPAPVTRDPAPGSAAEPDGALAGPRLDAVMEEANRAYDRGDYEDARTVAGRVLAKQPTNVRMLRIMVSASCIDGDGTVAQAHFVKLPPGDQEQMRVRCNRYGISFSDRP